MAILALKVLDKDSNTICVSSGEDFVDLVCTHTYEEGDRIVLETDEKNIHVHLQVDDALAAFPGMIFTAVAAGAFYKPAKQLLTKVALLRG